MTKEEARLSVMGAISMALKSPILQQGFEIICKENAELKKWKEDTIKARGNDYMAWSRQNDQLTKAKELLRKFMPYVREAYLKQDISNIKLSLDEITEAEQFFKYSEVEK